MKSLKIISLLAALVLPVVAQAAAPAIEFMPNVPSTVVVNGKTYHTGLKVPLHKRNGMHFYQSAPSVIAALPDAWDERSDRGCITAIRNQGGCGSCWAFSRAAALEAAACIAGKVPAPNMLDLAEQDTLVNDNDDYGCNGGFMQFNYEVNHGVTLESKCPYKASGRYSCSAPVEVKGLKWAFVGNGNRSATVDELRAAIYEHGVVSVTTAAGGSFDTNSDGVFRGCGDRGINHMVDFVGWRKIADGSFQFLMRNSWGTDWGKDGFGWMKQGCEETAVGSESAMVVWVDGPGPVPPIDVRLPLEILAAKGSDVPVDVMAQAGVTFAWSNGATGTTTWVRNLQAATPISVTATNAAGARTTTTVSILPN